MTLRAKLAAGLLAIAVILVIPLMMAVRSLAELRTTAETLKEREFSASLLMGQLREGLLELKRRETALLFVHDSASQRDFNKHLSTLAGLVDSIEQYHRLPSTPRMVRQTLQEMAKWAPEEFRAAAREDTSRADSISTHIMGRALHLADSSVQLGERDLRQRTADLVAAQASGIAATRGAAIAGLVLALCVAAVIAIALTRNIARPVTALERGMRAVEEGDLKARIAIDSARADEFGRLARSFDSMTGRLAELDKLKAEFVSVASHELKTPVNVIVGYLQLLQEGIYGPLTPEQLKVHQTLEAQAQSLLRLTRQLLDVSRFEAGGARLDPRRIVLADFFEELHRAFDVLARQRDVAFKVDVGPDIPVAVSWDPDQMNEVLGNLLANAFKFTPRGGRVALSADSVNGSIEMRVQDTGAGIPAEQLPRIFDKFYQADTQGAAKSLGSGLGLAIAKQIVEAHGGTIACESTVGVGTTFTIALPLQAARRSSSQRRPSDGRGQTLSEAKR